MAYLGWEKKGQCRYEVVSKVWMYVYVCKRADPGREERGQCDLLG